MVLSVTKYIDIKVGYFTKENINPRAAISPGTIYKFKTHLRNDKEKIQMLKFKKKWGRKSV